MLGRILLTAGGLLVVALFAALLAPFFVDWTDFRVEFEQRASRILGKKVVVHGDVDARILPFPSVTLHDVRVGQDRDGQPQLHAARFSMDMELAPFLSGEARIFDMRLEEPKARVRILPDGTLDWMRGSRADIPLRTVVIEGVNITNGSIDIIDEQSGQTRQLAGLNADLSAASLAGPWRGEGYGSLDGEEAAFTLATGEGDAASRTMPLRLRILPDAVPAAIELDGDVVLAEDRPAYNGRFAMNALEEEDESEPVEAPPPGPRLKGSFELTNERIRIPDYRLEVGPLNNPYVVTGEATLDTGEAPEFLLTADGQQIDVNRLGEGERAKTGRDAAASAQRRIQAVIDVAAQIPIPQVPGRASLSLPAVVANDTTVRDIRIDVRPAGTGWTVDSFAATFPGRTQVEAKGALTLADDVSFVGDMLVASNQPSGLAAWLSGSVDPAIRQLKTTGFSATVNLTQELQRFINLELAVGPASLRGSIERHAPAETVPSLSVDLAGNEIDLDAMRALGSLITGNDAGEDVLDHSIGASLKAERFTAFGVGARDVETIFTLSEGELALERLTVGDLAGASMEAQGQLQGSLLDYSGSGSMRMRVGEAAGFIAMLHNRLPRHPMLDRLAENSRWFDDTELAADIRVGGDTAGLSAQVTGTSNGSAVNAELALPTVFNLTGSRQGSLSVQLENDQTAVLLGQLGLDPLPFGDDGPARVSLDLRQEGDQPSVAKLSFSTDRTQFDGEGEVELSSSAFGTGQGRLTLRSEDVEPYLLMTGIGIPQFGTGLPTTMSTEISISPETVRLDKFAGEIGGNRVASDTLTLDRSSSVTMLSGDLAADSLDLAWLAEAVYGPVQDPQTGELSEKPFSMPIFGPSEARLKVRTATFRPGMMGDIRDFSALVEHRNGGIAIENAAGTWQGGKIGGRLAINNGEGTGIFQTRFTVEDADLAALVWDGQDGPVATGRFSGLVAAESTGKTPADLLGALNGSGEITIAPLTINRLDPEALPPLLEEVDKLEGEVTEERIRPLAEQFVRRGQAMFPDVVIPFTITDGEARAQNVTANTGNGRISGEVRVDLLEQALRGEFSIAYEPGDEGLAGGEPMVRWLYSGDLENPSVDFDVAPLTNFLSLRAFERERRRVEMLQASVLEKQRLRREVALYRFLEAERQAARERAEAEERARREEEERQRAEAAARAERERAEAEAREAEAAARRAEEAPPALTVPPVQELIAPGGAPLESPVFQSLPGVEQ
ncbi:AsmA family protein [Pseudorhizobium flavum]|uniref:AsmA family protein n=1 Tax=Pseudorhizobium flavum TaxID=1335061 RepID=UPI00376FCB85